MIHIPKTSVLSLNIDVGDYVMLRTGKKCKQEIQSKWKGPMWVVQAKCDLVSDFEHVSDSSVLAAHARRIAPHPVSKNASQICLEAKEQVVHYDTRYLFVESTE